MRQSSAGVLAAVPGAGGFAKGEGVAEECIFRVRRAEEWRRAVRAIWLGTVEGWLGWRVTLVVGETMETVGCWFRRRDWWDFRGPRTGV